MVEMANRSRKIVADICSFKVQYCNIVVVKTSGLRKTLVYIVRSVCNVSSTGLAPGEMARSNSQLTIMAPPQMRLECFGGGCSTVGRYQDRKGR